jgi:Predicted site-specific integrase-resolvase
MKLSKYAERIGVKRATATKWFHKGLIKGAYQLPTGTIIVPDEIFNKKENEIGETVIYARVSSPERRKTDLEYQAKKMSDFCISNGWKIDRIVKEVGSGLNDSRPKLMELFEGKRNIQRIVVEHKDRLTRFGFNYLSALAKARGIEIIVADKTENQKDDLMLDFVSVITSFCARMYGQKRGKKKKDKMLEVIKQ